MHHENTDLHSVMYFKVRFVISEMDRLLRLGGGMPGLGQVSIEKN